MCVCWDVLRVTYSKKNIYFLFVFVPQLILFIYERLSKQFHFKSKTTIDSKIVFNFPTSKF